MRRLRWLVPSLIVLGIGGGTAPGALARTWHVTPDGSGAACRLAHPCALGTAQAQVRAAAPGMDADLVVLLHDGTYRLRDTWTLGPADSGRNGHDVVYAAAPGAAPVLSGGRPVHGWRLVDRAHRLWRANVGGLETRQLYVDGVRARRAVQLPGIPGTVTRTATGFHTTSTAPQGWSAPTDVELVWKGVEAGAFDWVEARCRVTGLSGDANGTDLTVAQPCFDRAIGIYGANVPGAGLSLGTPSWAENDPSFLADDARPGRWALQRTAHGNRILYHARKGEDPRHASVVAAATQTLVRIGGDAAPAHDIVLRGLAFADSTWLGPDGGEGFPNLFSNSYAVRPDALDFEDFSGEAYPPAAVELNGAEDVRVEDGAFERIGAVGMRVESTRRAVIRGNAFRDLSAGAIMLGRFGPDLPGQAEDNVIADNAIDGTGQEYGASPGIYLALARRTLVSHNYVANTGYSGISMRGSWHGVGSTEGNHVVGNYVADVMRRTRDGGGIYSVYRQGEDWDHGLVVERNVVRNTELGFYFGLYSDIGSDYTTSRENVSSGFLFAAGGCASPYINAVRSVGNFLDGQLLIVCGGPVTDVTVDNVAIDHADPDGACAALPACAAIVAQAGLEPGYESRLAGTYRFDDVPAAEVADDVHAFPLNGVHAAIDFGEGQWAAAYETPGYATTTHARFATDAAGPRTLRLARGALLAGLTLEGSGTCALGDGTTTRHATLPGPGEPVHLQTGFATPGATVTIACSDAPSVVIDDLRVG